MEKEIEFIGIIVCDDCVQWLANGEQPPHYDLERDPSWDDDETETEKWLFAIDTEEERIEYSSLPCDHCGCKLHGNRFHAKTWLHNF